MIPRKPFDTYKWRWLSTTPTEGLLEPPVFLGVLRACARLEGSEYASAELHRALARVQSDTGTRVTLARSDLERNLIRNSGQYWRGMGLLTREPGRIELTELGRLVAAGELTQAEFASLIVIQTKLPNPLTYSEVDLEKWRDADLSIRPFVLILEVLQSLRESGPDSDFLTTDELVKVIVPLAGEKVNATEIAYSVKRYRAGALDVSQWPNCAPDSNDRRMAREFLLFLARYGFVYQHGASVQDEKFLLSGDLDFELLGVAPVDSISHDDASAELAIQEVQESELPNLIVRNRQLSSVLARPNQAKFREQVLAASSNCCLLTRESLPEVLEAAHIRPVNYGGDDSVGNGLCLRVDIHRLFDSGSIRISSTGTLRLSDGVRTSPGYAMLPEVIALPEAVNLHLLKWRENYL